jgi:hypothetical protein
MINNEQVVALIAENLPTTTNEKDTLLAFEKIYNKAEGSALYEVYRYLKKEDAKLFKKFDRFFRRYCKVARKRILASPFFRECLVYIATNHFLHTEKKKYPRYWEWNASIPFTYDLAVEAYNYTLDQYDTNKGQQAWAGYWSLVTTKGGKVTGVWLSDTADREYFWEYIYKKFNLPTK